MTVNIPAGQLSRIYLTIWQSIIGISDRELDVLAEILDKRRELVNDGLKEPYLSEYLFNTKSRKEYCDRLEITTFNFQNILSALKKKELLIEGEDGAVTIDERLIPVTELTFNFIEE